MAHTISEEDVILRISEYVRTAPENRFPEDDSLPIFENPLVGFASGSDPLFVRYKTLIDPEHLTPAEALAASTEAALNARASDNRVQNCTEAETASDVSVGAHEGRNPQELSVISWVLPIHRATRESNRSQTEIPSKPWAHTRHYGEQFNNALRRFVVDLLRDMGYKATAPMTEPFFRRFTNENGLVSNWSERHIAYVAGLGTFSLSDGFITERGIAHRCGSVVTTLPLKPTARTALQPYGNCLFYHDKSCRICIDRCPAGAISEKGHDKARCEEYLYHEIGFVREKYGVEVAGCGLCQTGVPCEFDNPVATV